jgi:transcriptional regulator with XRE-family HTH domain
MNTTPNPRGREQHASLNIDVIEQISAILRRKGMCQRDLAQLLGKRESEISKWMRGTHNFTLSTIAGIQEALGEKILDTPLNFSRGIPRAAASQ